MKKTFLVGTIVGLAIGVICFLSITYLSNESIVVVDSQKVLKEYQGFIEAQDYFEAKIKELKDAFNGKRKIYERKVKEYKILEDKLSSAEKSEKRQELEKMRQELMKLGTTIENQSMAEEDKLLEGVFNKVNDFVNRYGDKKGYSIILGANGQGNVMYIKEAVDVTQEVIEALNKEYINGIQ